MACFTKVNNERSETIELIKYMDSIVKRNTWQIKSIGGESTLNTGKKRMFPDVFIYGDTSRTQILQGWEVKMPDVLITDSAFIHDAQRKADVLGVNSCVIWNFTHAALYIKNNAGNWEKSKAWDETNHIKTRADVITYKSDWENLISIILCELNGYFLSGNLRPAKLGDMVSETIFAEIIERNKQLTAEHLKSTSARKTVISSHINQWWRGVEKEYKFDENDSFSAYAKFILINWINKFTFAHVIKSNHDPATIIESIDESITPNKALSMFDEITSKCDFFNIFGAVPYAEMLPIPAWVDLTDYNAFLCENGINQIPQETLQSVLENSVNQFNRSVSGVFTTPLKLAEILVKAGIDDLTVPCIDPCCGTGTIAKEIISAKESVIGIEQAMATTHASDKNSFSLQIANISMTKSNAMNLPSLLFQSNAFELCEGKEIEITDPQNGDKKLYKLPKFGCILSNLPFVAFDNEGQEKKNINTTIKRVRKEININLSGRIDLCQAILLKLKDLLTDNAGVAVITSNSWLGTLAGQEFFKALNCYFSVESIIASGNGKWFDNADVVTLMLFLKNKSELTPPALSHSINFGLINKKLSEVSANDTEQIIDSIKLKRVVDRDLLTFKKYSIEQINAFLEMNIALNACFYDINWLTSLKDVLCPITDLFPTVFRGMKTGQDEIYYLKNNNDVDPEYIRRIFKSAKNSGYLITEPDTYSFVCDKSIAELNALGHCKTLQWIDRFKGQINKSVPNKESFWTNLSGNILSGSEPIRLFTAMNPEQRIFYGLLKEPAQINQRAIGFKPLSNETNVELGHALLNSVIGIFYTEATGFPKGLGALDNRAENMKRVLMLDPRRLSADKTNKILEAFKPLLSRKIKTTFEEYKQTDRIYFEKVVSECYGYTEYFEKIRDSVLDMQRVRLSVKKGRR